MKIWLMMYDCCVCRTNLEIRSLIASQCKEVGCDMHGRKAHSSSLARCGRPERENERFKSSLHSWWQIYSDRQMVAEEAQKEGAGVPRRGSLILFVLTKVFPLH